MHVKFPKAVDSSLRYLKLKFLPKTLFFRTMLLIFIPLIVVQVVSIVAFFNGNWSRMGRKLSENLTSDIATVIDYSQGNAKKLAQISSLTEKNMDLNVTFYDNDEKHQFMHKATKDNKLITGFLEESLKERFPDYDTVVYMTDKREVLWILVDTPQGLYRFDTSSKNIFTSAVFGFVAWMVGTSLLLFLVAVMFLRIQVRSIADLAHFSEDFGKGIDNKDFKPYGSSEVRKAGLAFIKMKERIQRQISERTQMLAGVSHDLRTPLTRMRLQAEMMPKGQDRDDLMQDISEMEKMLDGYLDFVSGEAGEKSTFVDMNELILSILNKFRNKNALIRYATNDQVSAIQGREQGLKRALTNIISNAFNYGKTVAVKLESNNHRMEITVDDDGPGIPEGKRDDVFKAFYRVEGSRNKETGGVGLGLSIAKDVISSHGGTITLGDSDMGGLRVLISIPL